MGFALCPFCGQTLRTSDGQRVTTPASGLPSDSSAQNLTVSLALAAQKPVAAFVLAIIASVGLLFLGGVFALAASVGSGGGADAVGGLGFTDLICGVLLLAAALMMFRNGASVRSWGNAIIVLGVLPIIALAVLLAYAYSISGASGGSIGSALGVLFLLILPDIFAIIGGIMAFSWKPT